MDHRVLHSRESGGGFGSGAIALGFLALLIVPASPASAGSPSTSNAERGDDLNTISALRIEENEKGTYLRLESEETPSFSVFKLREPLRLVLDVSNSTLAAEEGSRDVENGAISRVALSTHKEEGRARVRLIVGFERPSHYDVKTKNHNIVVFVEGRQKTSEAGPARAKLEQTIDQKQQKLTRVRDKYQKAESKLDTLEKKLKAERQRAETKAKNLKALKKKQRQRTRQLERSRSKYKSARKALEKTRSKYESSRDSVDEMQKKLETMRRELKRLETRRRKADGSEQEKLSSKLKSKNTQLDELESKLESRRETMNSLKSRVETLVAKRKRAQKQVQTLEKKLKAQRERARRQRQKLERQQTEARKQVERLEKRLKKQRQAAEKRQQVLERKLEAKRNTVDNYRAKLEARDERIASLEQKLERLNEKVEKGETRGKAADKLEAMRKRLRAQKKKLAELKSKRSSKGKQENATSDDSEGPTARAVPMNRDETNTIQDIRLETKGKESRIIVELERPGKYKRLPWRESRAVMLLNDVELPEQLETKLEPDGQSGAVQFVSSRSKAGDQVRMEAALTSKTRETISQEGDTLIWEFAPRAAEPTRASSSSERARSPKTPPEGPSSETTATNSPRAPDQSGPVTSAPPRSSQSRTVTDPSKIKHVPGMARTEVTMDFRNADLQNVLRLFAKQGGVNIIAGDGVSGSITLRLRSVPLDQAFLIVLQSMKLGFEMRGDVIRVATQKQLLEEKKAQQEAQKRQQKLRPLDVFLMPISYAKASEMTGQVERLLSPRGSVSVDQRTNTLIIKDLPENIKSVRKLVGALDTQVPQVLIEARIVETNDTFSQEFGIQWGGDFTMAQGNGNPTGLAFPNVLGVGGGASGGGQSPTAGTSSNPNFAVNLPAPAGAGSGGAIGLTMGSIGGNVNLNLRLSAAEESGHAKIVSAPKVLTLNNEEATISQGTSIPISVVSAAGVQTVFVDATLQLTVTPQVTPDGNVQMDIQATKNEPDFQNTGAQGDPTIIRKSAQTSLLVGDGETTVIGGIYTRNSGSSVTGIPFLHQIPILGSLFKQTGRTERRSELLIFITPRVVNRAEALGGLSAGDVVGQGSSMGSSQSSGPSTGSGGGAGGNGGGQ